MRKRALINLSRLRQESPVELNVMVAELCETASAAQNDTGEIAHWGSRFVASGKTRCHFANPLSMDVGAKTVRWGKRFAASGKIHIKP